MKNTLILFTVILITTSCSTNRTLTQVKLKEGTKLISHHENDILSPVRKNYFIVAQTKKDAIASIELEEDEILISMNDKNDLIHLDTIYVNENLGIKKDSKFSIGNKFAYFSKLKVVNLKLDSLDLSEDGKSYLDTTKNNLNDVYFISTDLKYTENKTVFQTLTIPFKFRSATNNNASTVSTGFNAGIAFGYQWNSTKINPIYSKNNNSMVGYDRRDISFSLAPFLGLNSIKLNMDNTNQSVLTERNVLGISFGGVGVVTINKFNIGLALGFDYGLENSKNWDYQGGLWTGLVIGVDLIN
jgi:hypothetical protein